MIRIDQIKIPIKEASTEALSKQAARIAGVKKEKIRRIKILRRSIDARKKDDIKYVYNVALDCPQIEEKLKKGQKIRNTSLYEEKRFEFPYADTSFESHSAQPKRPIVIGAGPAGLFAALELTMAGIPPILIERGKPVEERMADVNKFWETGVLKPDSNVQFGEGGAGTFSDGKLNTLIKDKDGSMRFVLETFVEFGAPEEILYDYKPHIGTDVLVTVIKNIREYLLNHGCEIKFGTTVTDIGFDKGRVSMVSIESHYDDKGNKLNEPFREDVPCGQIILAIGHSARDTFKMLYERKVPMEAKEFAVGLRIEHPRAFIDEHQFGPDGVKLLGAAPYKLATKLDNGRGVYSFCMCPGGYVVNSSSEEGRLVVNGMSYSGRNGSNSNSAIVVSVGEKEYDMEDPLSGIEYQRSLEKKAYELGGGKIPQQRYGDFKKKVSGEESVAALEVTSQTKGETVAADLTTLFSDEINKSFIEGMDEFDKQMKGFSDYNAILSGVESRTSSPVRIPRDETFQSEIRGLYPCGEGAGYAGGITSAAMDGLKCARALIEEYNNIFCVMIVTDHNMCYN